MEKKASAANEKPQCLCLLVHSRSGLLCLFVESHARLFSSVRIESQVSGDGQSCCESETTPLLLLIIQANALGSAAQRTRDGRKKQKVETTKVQNSVLFFSRFHLHWSDSYTDRTSEIILSIVIICLRQSSQPLIISL